MFFVLFYFFCIGQSKKVATAAGRRIGCNDPISLSGHHALRHAIGRHGADPSTFAEMVFTGGHHNSLDALIAGEIDACVVDSVVRIGRARHDEGVASLAVIERLGPWPVQPLVARHDLPRHLVDAVRDAILGANDNPDVAAALRDAALTRLVPVDDAHYAPVRAALERNGLEFP